MTVRRTRTDADVPLADKTAFLADPGAYPERPRRVETIETHMSWLFLTATRVYKLKKPVRSASVDYATIAARARNCATEVRLNAPLAPGVYLDVVPLSTDGEGRLRLGNGATIVDWLVEMRRLPGERMLDRMIARGTVHADDVRRLSRVLAEFYGRAEPIETTAAAYLHRLEQTVVATGGELALSAYRLPAALISDTTAAQRACLTTAREPLAQRAGRRAIVEAHGDLRPEHVCLTPSPVFIDRLEFDRDLRILDPVDELSYLALECERLGAAWIGDLVLQTYAEATDDDPCAALVRFYKSLRASVRAMVAIWHLRDDEVADRARWTRRALEYLELAQTYAGAAPPAA